MNPWPFGSLYFSRDFLISPIVEIGFFNLLIVLQVLEADRETQEETDTGIDLNMSRPQITSWPTMSSDSMGGY